LESAHIIPVSQANLVENTTLQHVYDVRNGITLFSDLHKAFENHKWYIENNKVIMTNDMKNTEWYKYNGNDIQFNNNLHQPTTEIFNIHREFAIEKLKKTIYQCEKCKKKLSFKTSDCEIYICI